MNHRKTIALVMEIFDEEYRGKFTNTPARMKIWSQMLSGFDSETILAAAYHLASTRKDWAPDIATMREQCVLMAQGELQLATGAESWARIKLKMTSEPELELTDNEKAALAQTSTIFDLRRSKNETTDRTHYIKAFDKLIQKRHYDMVTLPEVKALAARNLPALPAKEVKELPASNKSQEMSYEEALEEYGDDMKNLSNMIGGD